MSSQPTRCVKIATDPGASRIPNQGRASTGWCRPSVALTPSGRRRMRLLLSAAKRRVAACTWWPSPSIPPAPAASGWIYIFPRRRDVRARRPYARRLRTAAESTFDERRRHDDRYRPGVLAGEAAASPRTGLEGALVNDNLPPRLGQFDDDGAARLAARPPRGRVAAWASSSMEAAERAGDRKPKRLRIITGDFTNDQAHALAKRLRTPLNSSAQSRRSSRPSVTRDQPLWQGPLRAVHGRIQAATVS